MAPKSSRIAGRSKADSTSPDGSTFRSGRHFVSVGTKLTGGILVVLAIVTAVAYLRVNRNEREQMLSAKERAATMVTELFAAGVTAPLSFNDDAGVREHIALLMASTNVVYAGLWRADGARRGEKIGEIARGVAVPHPSALMPRRLELERTANAVIVQKPVISESGELLGAALIECSLADENAAISAEQRRTLITFSATALGLAVVVVALSRLLVVNRLAQLAKAAKRLEEGEVVDIRLDTNDEVGALSRAFASMSKVIASREAQISQRNRDLRRVLDNVAEGLVTVRKDGTISEERSRAIDAWFGRPATGLDVFDYFDSVDQATGDLLRLGWTALGDDIMPVEVVLDQMRVRFEHEQRSFELDFSPIWLGPEEDQILEEILVAVRDVTATVERERAERAQREALRVFRSVLVDPAGFRDFLRNGSRLVEAIEQDSGSAATSSRLKRDLHTLKGDTGLFGLESIADTCHRIESRMQELGRSPDAEELGELRAAWTQLEALAAELDAGSPSDRIEIYLREYEEHLTQLKARRPAEDLIASVRTWANEPAERTLQRFVEQGRSLARQLGKGDTAVEMRVAPAGLRLAPARWAPVWSVFPHLLRNTFDHGVETRARRRATTKPARASVEISLTASTEGVVLRVTDDGRGIDWEKLRERAAQLGLPHATQAELEEALYGDGVTTRDQATEISGRGIGMGAFRDVVRSCGGTISIESQWGLGTTISCRFPPLMLEGSRASSAPKAPDRAAGAPPSGS
jgi:signal transduction histidine kinase/HPt (histidine-containing phosphotransfer) domain-containing protein